MSIDFNSWTKKAQVAFANAFEVAKDRSNPEITPNHLAQVVFSDPEGLGRQIVLKVGSQDTLKSIQSVLERKLNALPSVQPPPETPTLSRELMRMLDHANKLRKDKRDSYLGMDVLLISIIDTKDFSSVLQESGVSKSQLKGALQSARMQNQTVDNPMADIQFEALSKYGEDLTAKAAELDPVIGRDEEIRRVIRVLSRRTKNNPVLVGEPGVGKTAIVEGLAQRVVKGDVPSSLRGNKIISLDMGQMVAGASYKGEFEQRLKSVLKEVEEQQGKIILFIDEIHLVLGVGSHEGAMDAANILKPMLARGKLRTIGATTLVEYRKYVEKDAAFERRFQQVLVGEPSVHDTINILRGIKEKYEGHHGVRIADRALVVAAELSDRYIQSRFLPDKAIDLVDEACSNVRVQLDSKPEEIDSLERQLMGLKVEEAALSKEKDKVSKERFSEVRMEIGSLEDKLRPLQLKYDQEKARLDAIRQLQQKREETLVAIEQAELRSDLARVADLKYGALAEIDQTLKQRREQVPDNPMLTEVVGPDEIATVVSRWTGIPVQKLRQTERQKLLQLDEELHRRVVGQDNAVSAIASAVLRSRAGLAAQERGSSFLFLGPTGVGKTEVAKALASMLFDDEKMMIRIDMSEYMEKHSVSRLIGAPPGYVGHDEGGQLTEAVRRRPYSVVLFDEVEKANSDVMNVLLQVLDDGRLTDGKGRVVNFSNTVIIMTSNLGAEYLLQAMNEQSITLDQAKEMVVQTAKRHFRPEFLNRLDEILVFEPLGQQQMREVARLMVQSMGKRLKNKSITLSITDTALDFAVSQSYQPIYGARPTRRWLEQNIITDLSRMIIAGTLTEGSSVEVGVEDDQLTYNVIQVQNVNGVDTVTEIPKFKMPKYASQTMSDLSYDDDDSMQD